MRRIWRRLRRLLGQSRIRLPRRPLDPGDLQQGDRLQIGRAVYRVRGSLLLVSGGLMFRLEEIDGGADGGPVRLLAPYGVEPWVLVVSGRRIEVPGEGMVHYPAGDYPADDYPAGGGLIGDYRPPPPGHQCPGYPKTAG